MTFNFVKDKEVSSIADIAVGLFNRCLPQLKDSRVLVVYVARTLAPSGFKRFSSGNNSLLC